jgi:hypothetical protein
MTGAKKRNPIIAPRPDFDGAGRGTDEQLLAFVNQGGISAAEHKQVTVKKPTPNPKRRIGRTLRIPETIYARVEAATQSRTVAISDNSWILEAIVEKLEKESF